MKSISISLAKSEILEDVSLNTAYTGAKSSDDKAYNRVATIPQDDPLLSKFWIETGGRVIDQLKEFVVSSSLDEEKFRMTLEVSGAFEESLEPTVKDDIHAAVTAGVMTRWLRYTYPDKATEWESHTTYLLGSVLSKLCHRRRPLRIKQSEI